MGNFGAPNEERMWTAWGGEAGRTGSGCRPKEGLRWTESGAVALRRTEWEADEDRMGADVGRGRMLDGGRMPDGGRMRIQWRADADHMGTEWGADVDRMGS